MARSRSAKRHCDIGELDVGTAGNRDCQRGLLCERCGTAVEGDCTRTRDLKSAVRKCNNLAFGHGDVVRMGVSGARVERNGTVPVGRQAPAIGQFHIQCGAKFDSLETWLPDQPQRPWSADLVRAGSTRGSGLRRIRIDLPLKIDGSAKPVKPILHSTLGDCADVS